MRPSEPAPIHEGAFRDAGDGVQLVAVDELLVGCKHERAGRANPAMALDNAHGHKAILLEKRGTQAP